MSESFTLDSPHSAYIHIPFCRRRCYYCDFPISVLGHTANINTSGMIRDYVEALSQEIIATPPPGKALRTVFFGGGTPSLLAVPYLQHILTLLQDHFGLTEDVEISMEIDPGTFTLEQLQGYRKAGVNRVSLGVQAFQDQLLKNCGRFHSVQDILTAIALIHQVGFPNFSLDLISGLPEQTLQDWQTSLELAISLHPHHLSCYDLVLEPVTAFGKKYQSGNAPLPADEMTAQMYRIAQQILTNAGYNHYEISNYAQPGYQCQHNRVYWENRSYYGFGMGATSYVNQQRFTRPRTRQEYYLWVKDLIASEGKIDAPQTSPLDHLLETLMLGLRLSEGVNLSSLVQHYGLPTLKSIQQGLEPYYPLGWIEVRDQDDRILKFEEIKGRYDVHRLRLTDPEGFLFSNTVLAALFEQLT